MKNLAAFAVGMFGVLAILHGPLWLAAVATILMSGCILWMIVRALRVLRQ